MPIVNRTKTSASFLAAMLVAGATAFSPTPAHSYPKNWWKTHDGCVVFEHRGLLGKWWIIDSGTTYSYVGSRWNDQISSIQCEVYCTLTAWEHRDYKGASRTFESTVEYVQGAWNDRISSLSATCPN